MNLISRITHHVSRFIRRSPVQRSASWAQAFLLGSDDAPRAVLANPYSQSTWIYACVNAIAGQVAHTPFRIASGRQPLTSGPLVDLFNHPHPQLDRYRFWEMVVSWLLLRGKAFVVGLDRHGNILPVNPARTVPDRLLVLHADRCTTVILDHQLAGYRFQAGQNEPLPTLHLLPEEVLHLRLGNPFDLWDGQSPAAVASMAAQTDFAAAQFMRGLMLNNADTGIIITTDQQSSPEQREQILGALRERKRRAGTADRPLLLWGGFKIEKPSISMVDLDFLHNRKFSRQEICAIYKTPQEILGFTEDANRAVADAARLNWIENTVAPFCERLAAGFNPLTGRSTLFFDVESLPPMQRARRERFRAAREGFSMGVPLNVLNEVFDLGLPVLAHGDSSYLPKNLLPVGTVPPAI